MPDSFDYAPTGQTVAQMWNDGDDAVKRGMVRAVKESWGMVLANDEGQWVIDYRDGRLKGHGGRERDRRPWQWLVLPALARETAEAHPERCRVSLFLAVSRCGAWCGNDAHNPSGFDVPEHFREPEVPGQENHD